MAAAASIPNTLLMDFISVASEQMKEYVANKTMSGPGLSDTAYRETKEELSHMQQNVLERVVSEYNTKKASSDEEVSVATVEAELLSLRTRKDSTNDDSQGTGDDKVILDAIDEFHGAEGIAIGRCVLAESWSYFDDFDMIEGVDAKADEFVTLERQDILDYFALCCSVAKLRAVKDFLKGATLRLSDGETSDIDRADTGRMEDPAANFSTEQRINLLQQVLLRAVLGYPVQNPTIVVEEAKRRLIHAKRKISHMNESCGGNDQELQEALDAFILAMRLAYCAVWEGERT